MPDPNLNPEAKKDTILADVPMSSAQALREVGWIQPIDFVMVGLVLVAGVTLLYWNIFAEPSAIQVLACCLAAFSILQLWAIILVYRCAHFVILLSAYVNTMPEAAARMVVAFHSGRTPASPQMPQKPAR